MNRSVLALTCTVSALVLSSCATCQNTNNFPEDSEVAVKCTPVKALLSKNVRASGNGAVPWLFTAGGLYERNGSILDPMDAARALHVDAACRAWVKGAITAVEYGKIVLDNASAAIVQTTSNEDRQSVVDEVIRYLEDLKIRGFLPNQFDSGSVPKQVDLDSRLTQQELEVKLSTSMATIDGKIGTVDQSAEVRQALLMSRFDSIDRRLNSLKIINQTASAPPGSSVLPPRDSASVTGQQSNSYNPKVEELNSEIKDATIINVTDDASSNGLDVYFSTGNSEVSFSERQRVEVAAAGWRKSKATIYVMGFADPRGNYAYNENLSRARAQAVAELLQQLKVKVGAASSGGVAMGSENDSLRYAHLRPVQSFAVRR